MKKLTGEFKRNKVIIEELIESVKIAKNSYKNKFKMFLLTRNQGTSNTYTNARTKTELRKILKEFGY
ncbi:MAG: hypothetical protein AABY22_06020 [Nanoarchaeota archaeon]